MPIIRVFLGKCPSCGSFKYAPSYGLFLRKVSSYGIFFGAQWLHSFWNCGLSIWFWPNLNHWESMGFNPYAIECPFGLSKFWTVKGKERLSMEPLSGMYCSWLAFRTMGRLDKLQGGMHEHLNLGWLLILGSYFSCWSDHGNRPCSVDATSTWNTRAFTTMVESMREGVARPLPVCNFALMVAVDCCWSKHLEYKGQKHLHP